MDDHDETGESNLCLSGSNDYLKHVFVLPVGDLHVGIHAARIVLPLFQQVHLRHNARKIDAYEDNHGDTTSYKVASLLHLSASVALRFVLLLSDTVAHCGHRQEDSLEATQ